MSSPKQDAIRKYRETSKKLADPKMLHELRKLFEKTYTLPELLDWLHSKLHWDKGRITRYNDPISILNHGKGRCAEYSILFTAFCLAHGYRARVVLDLTDHVWTEVWNPEQKRWIHVDPSEKRIDDPKMYERKWKKNLTQVYAFENGRMENVTKNYKLNEKE
jgi:hypothetical protein